MWFDLYLVSAVVAAVAACMIGPHFQSDDPGDIARGIWSAIAGALWPLIVVGAAQILAVRYVARRLRPAGLEAIDLAPLVGLPDASLHS
jgi:hypothetical protein